MSEKFDFNSIYEDETWTVLYENAEGYQEKFYECIKNECEKSNFPNLTVTINDYSTGGWFSKETTKMLKIKAKKSAFMKFEIYYRAQVFGNVVLFTRLECMERNFFDTLTGKVGEELKANLRAKCRNMAQYEEFVAIDSLANIIYDNALQKMDPNFKERKMLRTKL
ncbi:MAG: hypothetical protein JW866_07630 [Ignavibacteriales bacterium]|nr:hypothetical protein [Ignavibacteriales bacterium]